MLVDKRILNNPKVLKIFLPVERRLPSILKRSIGKVILNDLGAYHGQWDDERGTLTINPKFGKDIVEIGGKNILRWLWTFAHESGHALDHLLGDISDTTKWKSLSGWRPATGAPPAKDEGQYTEMRPGWDFGKSEWIYNIDAHFLRDYSKRSPHEDFSDVWAAYLLGLSLRIKDMPEKMKFVQGLITERNM